MRVYPFTEKKLQQWIKEGRGTGTGAQYQSWLQYTDFNSIGNKHRASEGLHGRMCVLFSNVEYRAFLGIDASPIKVNLYDQYALLRDETQEIASDLGIEHPRDPETGIDIVMTTDLVGTKYAPDGSEIEIPFSCKLKEDLKNFNVSEHLEIERIYWLRRNRKLQLFTEDQRCLTDDHFNNLKLLFPHRLLDRNTALMTNEALTFEEKTHFVLKEIAATRSSTTILEFAKHMQIQYGLTDHQWLGQVFHLIYRGTLKANLLQGDLRQANILDIAAQSNLGGGLHIRRVS